MKRFNYSLERRWSSNCYQFLKTDTKKLGIEVGMYKSDGSKVDEGIFYGHAIAVKDGYKIKEGDQTPFFADLKKQVKEWIGGLRNEKKGS